MHGNMYSNMWQHELAYLSAAKFSKMCSAKPNTDQFECYLIQSLCPHALFDLHNNSNYG